jgi:hypothetical protein
MKATKEPTEVEHVTRLNEFGPDDLFICCASFEDRCVSSTTRVRADFRTRFAVIFVLEETLYKTQVETNLFRIQRKLGKATTEGVFVIRGQRDDPIEGIAQLRNIWETCRPKNPDEPFISVDISGFTKIYLFELLHYLVVELKLGIPRFLHTIQTYLPSKLTRGVQQITTIPNFFGNISMEKRTVLVLFLGFESERSLIVWKHFNPVKTIALITNPPRFGNLDYLRYAQKNNSHLLSQSSVEVRDVPADNPCAARRELETIYGEIKDTSNMIIGPLGTKPQAVGVFLFCLEHPAVQVVYSFPAEYTKSYLRRKPGPTLLLPLAPEVTD